jgi:PAS domain S-box-containing protein
MIQDRNMADQWFMGNSEMAIRMRAMDWSQTRLGPIATWPQSLRSALSICLNSRFPIAIYWGPESILLYNDAWRPIVGDKHPWSLGRPGGEVWAEIWNEIGVELASVLATGEGTFHYDEQLAMHRFGYTEECFFEYTFNPIQGQSGSVEGVFNIVTETTYRVLSDRRTRLLQEIASHTSTAKTIAEACKLAITTIQSAAKDIPFSLLYVLNADGRYAQLCDGTEAASDSPFSPEVIDLTRPDTNDLWGIAHVLRTGQPRLIEQLVQQVGNIPGSPWPEMPQEAVVLPIVASSQSQVIGALVAVASPRRRLDDRYRDFLNQVAAQIAMALVNARSYQAERRRAEELAELDRAKTTFFSNVSHEFRTPLTLMLSPLEDLMQQQGDRLQPTQRDQLQMVHRNGLRLQKLVNTLLDFSRMEAGRMQACYEPTDLAAFTADLASTFRSLIEQAGLTFAIECSPLPEPVYVDHNLWEKIVLNLLSNAFKFTFAGDIAVRLRHAPSDNGMAAAAVLEIQDTGVGIPAADLPRLFERFHRVNGMQSRSYEGSGIGLALVQELVKLHGGTIQVTSQVNQGSTFTITLPLGAAHLPVDQGQTHCHLPSAPLNAPAYLSEAERWLAPAQPNSETNREAASTPALEELFDARPAAHSNAPEASPMLPALNAQVLLVDDNADMRDYLQRLLSPYWQVATAIDGLEALEAIAQRRPDLIVSDVMMPRLDGFELLQRLRANPQTKEIPVILLSARAGEEARIEGLAAGADDYLIKPFSARELLARVETTLKLAQLRRETETALRQSEEQLRIANQRFELATTAVSCLIYDWDMERGIVERTDGLTQLLGYSLAEVEPSVDWWQQQIHPEDLPHLLKAGKADLITRDRLHYEYRVRHKDGRYIYVLDQGIIVTRNAAGYPTRLVGSTIDITERKQAEAERERLLASEKNIRAQAETANRIKDEFLAVLSHELRSPLNPILGWTKLLQTGNLDADKTQQALDTIERNAKLQSELIEDLLDVSRILRGKLRLNVGAVNLMTVVQGAIETVRLSAETKGIGLITPAASDSPPLQVLGDSTRLQQVVWNLLSNAIKFTPAGGKVQVELEAIAVAPAPHPTHAQITVRDTGKGMHPDFVPYVFDYFRQEDGATTRKFGGLGLGLAIVRHLVELHGGSVNAESLGENQGATFRVQLPLAALPSRSAIPDLSTPEGASPSDRPPLAGLYILVVDDEPDSCEFAGFVLKQAGASVVSVNHASDALVRLTRSRFDLLLSDIGMPDMDGYMLIQQVRARSPEHGGKIAAIALTAYAGEMDHQRALQAGFHAHVSKPIEPERLIEVVASLWSERRK